LFGAVTLIRKICYLFSLICILPRQNNFFIFHTWREISFFDLPFSFLYNKTKKYELLFIPSIETRNTKQNYVYQTVSGLYLYGILGLPQAITHRVGRD